MTYLGYGNVPENRIRYQMKLGMEEISTSVSSSRRVVHAQVDICGGVKPQSFFLSTKVNAPTSIMA